MAKSLSGWYWHLGLASFIASSGAIASSGNCVLAQVTPDGTLGAESSVVTPTNVNGLAGNQIDGGAARGANLFHSFDVFSVPTGGEASFNNALDIQNIISRVTGGSISNIDGLLRANGTANLFLLNPNGIIFGPNASLNIGGSFLGSTASSLNFADGTSFSATAPTTTPLLTISVPIGLQYGSNAGSIQVQGNGQGTRTTTDLIDTTVGLRVEPNQTLAIVGGDVALSGGTLKTAGGRIELGSVAGAGRVNLTPTNTGWVLGYEGVTTFGDIQLSGQATVDASGAGGGDIQVQGRQVTLTNGSSIEASTLGAEPGGTLNVNASDSVELIGRSVDGRFSSALSTQVYPGATGAAGNLTLETGRLLVRDGAQVLTSTSGTGAGGTLSVTASDAIELIGTSANGQVSSGLYAQTAGDGDAGDLTVATGRLLVRDGAQVADYTLGTGAGGTLSVTASDAIELIGTSANGQVPSGLFATTAGEGDAGDLTVATGRLLVSGGAQVSDYTLGSGAGGTLSVTASDAIKVIGTSANGQVSSGLLATTAGEGDAGDLTVATGRLLVRDGAQINASTFSTGAGGTLSVTTSDAIELIGTSANGQVPSGLFAQTQGEGDAGDLTIATGRLLVSGGAVVSSRTVGTGAGGTLSVTASDAIEAIGRSANGQVSSGLFAGTEGDGDGGDMTIATGRLLVRDGAQINASTFSTGAGGTLSVTASDAVEVIGTTADGQAPSGLFAGTEGDGDAGDLTIATGRLLVRDGAQVSSSTSGTGAGGTLSVTASDVIEVIGRTADDQFSSSLIAQTEGDGDAGDMTIATRRLLVSGGAQVSTATLGTGTGGTLSVTASDVIELIGTSANGQFPSGLRADTEGDGDAGDLTIATGRLLVRDGAQIGAGTLGIGTGAGGTLSVTASDVIEVIGSSADGQVSSGLFAQTQGEGDAGDLTIATGRLLVRDGAQIGAGTLGTGAGGTLSVTASDAIKLIGTSDGQDPSGLFADTQGEGDAGDLTIATGRLLVRDGAQVSADTFGTGAGGTLSVTASDAIEVIGSSADGQVSSGLFAQTQGEGDAGDLTIATGRLTVQDGAQVAVSSRGSGNAGNLEVTADSIRLDNQAFLSSDTPAGQGNIFLNSQDLVLRRGSNITTNARGTAEGGNITIDTDVLAAIENSDISANSDALGGQVTITASGIFGTEYRARLTPLSDITATGGSPELSGSVEINRLDVDPTQGLVELPAEIVDASNQIAQACPSGVREGKSKFIVTGHGGLPPSPHSPLTGDRVLTNLATLDNEVENISSAEEEATNPTQVSAATPIVEATGWMVNKRGQVVLTASVPSAINIPWLPKSNCNAPKPSSDS